MPTRPLLHHDEQPVLAGAGRLPRRHGEARRRPRPLRRGRARVGRRTASSSSFTRRRSAIPFPVALADPQTLAGASGVRGRERRARHGPAGSRGARRVANGRARRQERRDARRDAGSERGREEPCASRSSPGPGPFFQGRGRGRANSERERPMSRSRRLVSLASLASLAVARGVRRSRDAAARASAAASAAGARRFGRAAPAASASAAPAEPAAARGARRAVAKWTGLSTPESVLYDADADRYLVSNINGKPDGKDNNGFISVLSPDGTTTTPKWIEGGKDKVKLDAPEGHGDRQRRALRRGHLGRAHVRREDRRSQGRRRDPRRHVPERHRDAAPTARSTSRTRA